MGLFDNLPSGWSQAKDPQGETYYYNRSSGETSYTKPEKKGRGLPAGWAETKDASGTTYYYNSSTSESTYTRPVSGPQIGKSKALTMAGGPAPPPSAPPVAQLPPGWVKTPDGNGDFYYWNQTTGETSVRVTTRPSTRLFRCFSRSIAATCGSISRSAQARFAS